MVKKFAVWPCETVDGLARLDCYLLLYIRKFSQFSKYEPTCRPTNITSHYSPGTLASFNCLSKVSARNIAAQSVYSVIHISIPPSKELCSKMASGEVDVSLP